MAKVLGVGRRRGVTVLARDQRHAAENFFGLWNLGDQTLIHSPVSDSGRLMMGEVGKRPYCARRWQVSETCPEPEHYEADTKRFCSVSFLTGGG